ncbi:MAG TPA: hypothetical protein VMH87_12930 [Pseudomonadales bacterium]|nr:hypothetical protein [Pseudomonadales bacterium]
MNPLIKKEIRLVLPAWIGAMILAIAPAWVAGTIWNLNTYDTRWLIDFFVTAGIPVMFTLGILLLGLSSFGQEFSHGTFTVLLSQPMERSRIWRTKILILFIAFLVIWAAAAVSILAQLYLHDYFPYNQPLHSAESGQFHSAIGFLTLSVLVVSSGGLWTTLLLRQVTAAFWFTLLTPLAIVLGICSWFNDRLDAGESINRIIVIALVAYSVVGFIAAAFLFRRCQDLQWTGGEISLPGFQKISGLGNASLAFRPRHWFFALCWKEILLHQVNLLIAGILLILNLACIVTLKFHPRFQDPDVQFVFESIWLLWLLVPLLTGCAAIAEERRLGVVESQWCLPVSRRAQLFVKFSAALVLSLLLGGAMPLLMAMKTVNGWIFLVAAAIFFISFYGSSTTHTTLQAIGTAIVTFIAIYLYIVTGILASEVAGFWLAYYPPGTEILRDYLSFPILLIVFGWLICWNFKWLHQGRKLWWYNIVVVLAAFICISVLTPAIFFRTWEYLTPLEPSPGPARLSASALPEFSASLNNISVHLPDGRIWTAQIHSDEKVNNRSTHFSLMHWNFLDGSAWNSATWCGNSLAAVKSDGTLWSIKTYPGPSAQVGFETNWLRVAGAYWPPGFLLLKNDGTLWFTVTPDFSIPPHPIRDGTNFTDIFSSSETGLRARKNDGSLWTIDFQSFKTKSMILLFPIHQKPDTCQKAHIPAGLIELSTNGDLSFSLFENRPHFGSVPFGKNSKWEAVAAGLGNRLPFDKSLFTIRSDGTLWEWVWADPMGRFSPERLVQDTHPLQLGHRSDWVALLPTSFESGPALALAADGSLWAWNQPSRYQWLAPSRKPVYMGNIFEGVPVGP